MEKLGVKLSNTPAGGLHPGHIHANTAAQGGGAFTFNAVNGDTGISTTNVAKLITALSDTIKYLLIMDILIFTK
jgi:hypothetical protein